MFETMSTRTKIIGAAAVVALGAAVVSLIKDKKEANACDLAEELNVELNDPTACACEPEG